MPEFVRLCDLHPQLQHASQNCASVLQDGEISLSVWTSTLKRTIETAKKLPFPKLQVCLCFGRDVLYSRKGRSIW